MTKRSLIAGLLAVSAGTTLAPSALAEAANRAEHRLNGEIESVTVYRGQALVTRSLDLNVQPGIHEVIVSDLPAYLVEGSLHAEAGADVSIRSVRYREQPVRTDVREEVQQIDTQLDELRSSLARLSRRSETIEGRKAYVKNLESFTTQNAMTELSKGVLDAGTLKELSEFIFAEQEKIEEQEIELREQREEVEAEIQLLEREKNALGARSTRTAREAVIMVETRNGPDQDLNLRYLVNRASWDPSHTVRADTSAEELVAEYFASIQQTSGEDWNDVEMKLSTATPSLVAKAPQLTSLRLELRPNGSQTRQSSKYDRDALMQRQIAADQMRQSNVAVFGNSRSATDNFADLDSSLNRIAMDYQILELQAGTTISAVEQASTSSAGHTVTYTIPGRTSLPSRAERQSIQIAATPLEGKFYKVAIPLLTSFVYEEAMVVNESSNVLLSGPVTTYADGQFVGYSMFDDIAMGERMIVGLGINSDLRSERVVIDQQEDIQGGNQIVTLTVQLSVQNFGNKDALVRLIDRLPQVDPQQVQLEIVEDGAASSPFVDDPEAVLTDGRIAWNLRVPAKSIADEAASVTYTIRIAHDRQMSLTGGTP